MAEAINPWLSLDARNQLMAQQAAALEGEDAFTFIDPTVAAAMLQKQQLAQQASPIPFVPPAQSIDTMTEERTKTSGKGMMDAGNYRELMDRLNAKELDSLKQQGISVEELKGRLANLDQQAMPINLQPAAALVDTWTGSKLAPYAQPLETPQTRAAAKEKLQEQILRAQQGLSENEIALLRSQLNNQFQLENLDYRREADRQKAALEGRKLDLLAGKGGGEFTPAQKKVDTEFGKTYDEDVVKGGLGRSALEIQSLEKIKEDIDSGALGDISGPSVGSVPLAIRRVTNPQSVAAQQQIEKAVQASMRETLGAQFTEKEGAQLLQRTFDPSLPPAENARRLQVVVDGLKAARDAKIGAIQYYEQAGTLKGYSGYKDAGGEFLRTVGDFKKKPAASSQDAAALKWANDNPTDPRAQKILQLQGAK